MDAALAAALAASVAAAVTAAVTLVVSLTELRSQRATLRLLQTAIERGSPGTDQSWFWTPEWQAGEAEADRQIMAHETTFFASADEFIGALESRVGRTAGSGRA